MNFNTKSRSLTLNSYVGMLAITIVGSMAALYIVHVANDVAFTVLSSPAVYESVVSR